MSSKFTLNREGKISKTISKILKSGASLISGNHSKASNEEKADRMLEAALRREAVKTLHKRRRYEVARKSRNQKVRQNIIAKQKKVRRRNKVQ